VTEEVVFDAAARRLTEGDEVDLAMTPFWLNMAIAALVISWSFPVVKAESVTTKLATAFATADAAELLELDVDVEVALDGACKTQ
jgi:hypothetical protein